MQKEIDISAHEIMEQAPKVIDYYMEFAKRSLLIEDVGQQINFAKACSLEYGYTIMSKKIEDLAEVLEHKLGLQQL